METKIESKENTTAKPEERSDEQIPAVVGTLLGLNAYKIIFPEKALWNQSIGNRHQLSLNTMKTIHRDEIHYLVQNKAFRLGYKWGSNTGVHMDYCKYLFFAPDGLIYHTFDVNANEESDEYYKHHGFKEIKWEDFMRLPEPNA